MALWGGRFTQAADQRFKQFNDSLRFDYRLAEQDITGSVAWSKALVTVGVLSQEEQQQLEQALQALLVKFVLTLSRYCKVMPKISIAGSKVSLSTKSARWVKNCIPVAAVTTRWRRI